jgi:phage terminase large subunit-like protein
MLKDAIQNRAIRHNGDPDLREHATNALAKIEGDKIRIVKKNANAKVDLLVCLSMANARAVANGLD